MRFQIAMGVMALAIALPAAAHHSFAMFDNSRSITIHGKVSAYQFTNPHAYLDIDADSATGEGAKPQHYTLEMTSPNMLVRGGWSSRCGSGNSLDHSARRLDQGSGEREGLRRARSGDGIHRCPAFPALILS